MLYVVPLVILCLTLVLFFIPRVLSAGSSYRQFGWGQAALRVLAALPLLFSGVVLHLIRPAEAVSMIPPGFPDPKLLVSLSGVFEIAGAVALVLPGVGLPLRRLAGVLIAVMMIAIFPANVYVAGKTLGGLTMPCVPVRTAMQVLYILLVLVAAFGFPIVRRSHTTATPKV